MSSKKSKVEISRREDLQDIDSELDSALGNLDTAVQNIGRLLETIEKSGTEQIFAELPDDDASPDGGASGSGAAETKSEADDPAESGADTKSGDE